MHIHIAVCALPAVQTSIDVWNGSMQKYIAGINK